MIRLACALLLALTLASPAQAHRLRVFATAEGATITGYAFFVGGGRPQGSTWTARSADGTLVATGTTDNAGAFRFDRPAGPAADIIVTVDTHDAHVASVTITAGGAPLPEARPATPPGTAALVEAAVQRQVAPVLERLEMMDARMRLTDALSGIFFILGLAGMALWARGRRR